MSYQTALAERPVTDTDRFARCIAASKRVRWDIDADVIRARRFDLEHDFLPEGLTKVGEVPAGYLYVDGAGLGDVGHGVLRDRRILAEEGVVVVIVTVDVKSGEVIAGPEIITRGWVYAPEAEDLLEEARAAVIRGIEEADETDVETIRRHARKALGQFVSDRTRRRPMIVPVIMEA